MAVFVIVYFFSPAELFVARDHRSDSSLAIVDLTLAKNPNTSSEFPLLDVKLRNSGDTAAFLKRARVEVLERVNVTDCQQYKAEPITWTYDLNLDAPAPVQLSQSVPPRGVDRFAFVVGHSLDGADQHAFYKLRLILEYDEDSKVIRSDPFTLYLPGMASRIASVSGPPECFETLQKTLEPIRSWPVAYSVPNPLKKEK